MKTTIGKRPTVSGHGEVERTVRDDGWPKCKCGRRHVKPGKKCIICIREEKDEI